MIDDEQKIEDAKKLLAEDQKKREEGFNKELAELKKKWNVNQHPTVGDELVQKIIEVLTSVKIDILTRSK